MAMDAISAPAWRSRGRLRLSEADRASRRRARLLRRAASHRKSCEDFLGRRLGPGAADRAVALSRRGAAGPAIAGRRGAHDRDARPDFAGTSDDQRRHRRRSGREQGRRAFSSHDDRYDLTREFLEIYTALLRGETVTCSSKHLQVEAGKLLFLPFQEPMPPLYFGGSSDAGIDVAAQLVDKYLTWGEPPEEVAKKIATSREAALARGRKLRSASDCMSSSGKPRRRLGARPTS